MEGGRGEDGEQIVPQPEIAEAAAEGGEEQDAGSVSRGTSLQVRRVLVHTPPPPRDRRGARAT
jgi:hypothetical protein